VSLLGRLRRLLGYRGAPPVEVFDLRGGRNGPWRWSAPRGGWRCRTCGAPAEVVATWPAAVAGFHCAAHAPDPRGHQSAAS
jgi:hypothetical protein